jgi:hypothetical protein
MMKAMFQRILLCLCILLHAGPGAAEVELHIVGIYEGYSNPLNRKIARVVPVTLDRPGAEVILVLSSYRGVDWEITTTPGTAPPTLVLCQIGKKNPDSTIRLNGKPVPDPTKMSLPLTYRPEGDDFRALVDLVPARFGVRRMASYSGSYNAPKDPFVINRIGADDRLDPDYLRPKLASQPLPDTLHALLPPGQVKGQPPVALTDAGFALTDTDGQTRTIPLPPDMPPISWPVAAVRDAAARMLYGVLVDGRGGIYAYDEARQHWRVLGDLDQFTVGGMLLDPKGNRLILTLSRYADPVALASHSLAGPDDAPLTMVADLSSLPGLTDLYDPGNGPEPVLVPAGIDGDLLLLTSTGTMLTRLEPDGEARHWRAYLVNLTTGAVEFVGYEGGMAGE